MAHRMTKGSLKSGGPRQCAFALGLAVIALIAGTALLFVTFWLAYAVIFLGTDAVSAGSSLLGGPRLGVSHGWRMLLSLIFVVLLFIQTATSNAEPPPAPEPEQLPSIYTDLWWRTARLRAELNLMAHPIESAHRISYWLGMGPRCVWYSGRAFRRFLRLLRPPPELSDPEEPPL